jgi:hypothetical protein
MNKFGTILFSSPDFQNEFKQMSINNTNLDTNKLSINVPDSFDGSIVWKDYFIPIQNQSNCISCWALASTFVLSSRLSIYTKGKYKFTFSSAKMIFSERLNVELIKEYLTKGLAIDFSNRKIDVNKCNSQSLMYANQYLYRYGVPEMSCVDDKSKLENVYNSKQLFGDTYDICPETNTEMISHRAEGYYYVPGATSKDNKLVQGKEYNIRRDIYHWGPCSTAMKIFNDFLTWDGKGIYEWDGKSELIEPYIGHSVVIVGWGTENDTDYWIIRNSWGANWGNKGYFKMKRGTNNCELEENVFVCYPSIPGIRLYLEYPILFHVDDFVIRGLWGVYDNGIKLTTKEKIVLRKKDISQNKNQTFLYDSQFWVDFSQMIAGELSTFRYLVKVKENYYPTKKKICSAKKVSNAYDNLIIIILFVIFLKCFFL